MHLSSVTDWIAFGALLVTLGGLAWAAIKYVKVEQRKARQADFDNFYRTLERIHNREGALILQAAAIFELRNFPEYQEFTVRLCNNSNRLFPTTPLHDLLANEFNATRAYFGKESDG